MFQLAIVALLGSGHGFRVHTSLAASIVALVSTLALLVLSDKEHLRVVQPSAIIQAFFFFTILLDLPRVRTQWFLDDNFIIAILTTVTFGLRFIVFSVESLQKWRRATVPPESIAPEYRQGLIGRTFFTWLNPMFMEGYKRDLNMGDLFPIDNDLKGQQLYERLLKHWNTGTCPLHVYMHMHATRVLGWPRLTRHLQSTGKRSTA